jgi:hypothetical protein
VGILRVFVGELSEGREGGDQDLFLVFSLALEVALSEGPLMCMVMQ